MLRELQMRKTSFNLFDGIGSWKRRPIRAGRKTYMPSSKRWGKITVTKMPVPSGKITTTKIMQGLEKSEAEQCQDKTGPEVESLEEKTAMQSQSQSD